MQPLRQPGDGDRLGLVQRVGIITSAASQADSGALASIYTEAQFLHEKVLPLLGTWALPFRTEQFCRLRVRGQVEFGRIDVLVHTADNHHLLTLFENKRRIVSPTHLDRAVRQPDEYARAKRVRSVVIAAPEVIWRPAYGC